MNLLELCEPLFLKVCELNRMGRMNRSQDYLEVRAEIKGLFEDMKQRANATPRLAAQFNQVELPLICFVDSIIATSQLKFAGQWMANRLAAERFKELAGDARFLNLLQTTLADPSDEASERLTIFYVCLGLGFVGELADDPAELKRYMDTMLPRVRPVMDVERTALLCPEAYESVNTANLIPPPVGRLGLVITLFVFLVLAFLAGYYGMFLNASDQLTHSIEKVREHQK